MLSEITYNGRFLLCSKISATYWAIIPRKRNVREKPRETIPTIVPNPAKGTPNANQTKQSTRVIMKDNKLDAIPNPEIQKRGFVEFDSKPKIDHVTALIRDACKKVDCPANRSGLSSSIKVVLNPV